MSNVDALAAFLNARLDEDERAARAASPGPWSANAEHDEVHGDDGIPVADGFALSNRQLRATVDHIVRHDPVRVLRDVEAKRRMLDWLHRTRDWAIENNLWSYDETEPLLLIALPYADHPDFDPAWRPS